MGDEDPREAKTPCVPSVRSYADQYQQRPLPDDTRLESASPCPFCGSLRLELARMQNYVHCRNCGADGPEVPHGHRGEGWLEALHRWNRRAT